MIESKTELALLLIGTILFGTLTGWMTYRKIFLQESPPEIELAPTFPFEYTEYDDTPKINVEYYSRIIGDEDLTHYIIFNAYNYNIPLNKFIALAFIESSFNPKAINESNRNGSKDYGLYQLNSTTYKDYSEKYLLNPKNNIELAASHLNILYERYGNWDMAFLTYHLGPQTEVDIEYIKYLSALNEYEKKLMEEYYNETNK